MYKIGCLILALLSVLMQGVSQTGIVSYKDVPFEKVGVYTYQFITPTDTFSENFDVEKYAIQHKSNTLPLTGDRSYYPRDILLYATKLKTLQPVQSRKRPSEPLNIYYYDSTLCVVCSFHIYPGNATQYLDLREEVSVNAFIGGCYQTPYKLVLNLEDWEYFGYKLFRMMFYYNYSCHVECLIENSDEYARIEYYKELSYLHNVGFIYRHYCYNNEDYYVNLTHIEGIPLYEYLLYYKNTMCKYYGAE